MILLDVRRWWLNNIGTWCSGERRSLYIFSDDYLRVDPH
jgi:hypothetical protein